MQGTVHGTMNHCLSCVLVVKCGEHAPIERDNEIICRIQRGEAGAFGDSVRIHTWLQQIDALGQSRFT